MRERQRLRQLAMLKAAQAAQLAAARQDLSEALKHEDSHRQRVDEAEQEVQGAIAAWGDLLTRQRIHPELLGSAAATLVHSEDKARQARTALDQATRTTDAQRETCLGRERRADETLKLLRRAKRKLAQRAQERTMSAIEDRTAFDWTRR